MDEGVDGVMDGQSTPAPLEREVPGGSQAPTTETHHSSGIQCDFLWSDPGTHTGVGASGAGADCTWSGTGR
jgi:hypothetical protein